MNHIETQQLETLEIQSQFYIELNKILTADKSKISMTDWYNFVVKNKEIFEKYSILTLISEFETIDKRKYKQVIKLLKNPDFIMYIQAITMQIVKDNKFEYSQTISQERESYKKKVDEVISLTTQQEIIIKKAKQLETSISNLKAEIQEYRLLIKRQSNNIEENIKLIDELSEKENLLVKALRQSHSLVKEGKKLWIFVEVANSKWELRLNSTAVNATKKQTILSYKEKEFSPIIEERSSSKVIKAWDDKEIERFELKDIDETKEEKIEEEFNVEAIRDMLKEIQQKEESDRKKIKELEEELKKLKETTDQQSKKIKSLKAEKKDLKRENESLKKTVIVSGW